MVLLTLPSRIDVLQHGHRSRRGVVALVVALVATMLPLTGSIADASPVPFVTGGGSIDVPVHGVAGAESESTLNTGFVVRPSGDGATGRTTASVRKGGPSLRATSLTSLSVDGAVARWTGRGTFDGRSVVFEASAVDGDLLGEATDRFRIRVLDGEGLLLLDTEPGTAPGAEPTTAISGQVVIHGGETGGPPPADEPPTAAAGTDRSIDLGETVSLDGSASSDPDGDELAYRWTVVTAPAGATAAPTEPTAVSTSLTPDAAGVWEVELTVEAGGLTDTDSVRVVVEPPQNTPPTAVDDEVATDEDVAITIDVLANDTDGDGDAVRIASVGAAARGTTEVVAGAVRYVPDPDTAGPDAFDYVVTDGAATASATVTIDVRPVNDAPVADAGTDQQVSLGATVELDGSGSTDVDGPALSYVWSVLEAPAGADATPAASEAVSTTLVPDTAGTWRLQLLVSDGSLRDTDEVLIDVLVVPNTAPTATDDAAETLEDTPVVIDVLANDADAEGGPLSVASFDTVASDGGTVSLSADGRLVFTPAPDSSTQAAFGYVVTDGSLTDSATVVVDVAPVNDPPVAPDQTVVTDEDEAVVVDVLSDATDVDGDVLTVDGTSDPADGTAEVLTDGTILYTPDPDVAGPDTFTYTVTDGDLTATGTVFVSVLSQPDPPVADAGADVVVEVGERVLLDGTGSSDPDGETLSYAWSVLQAPAGATTALVGPDSATPSLVPDAAGTWELELTVSDGTATASDRVLVQATAPTGVALTIRDPFIGVDRTTPATVTLPAPAPVGGTVVDLVVDDPAVLQLSTRQVVVPAGGATATVDVTGLAVGTAQVTATATGTGTARAAVTVTAQELTILDPIEIAPEELTSVPVQLAEPAVTDTIVTFAVVDPTVALLREGDTLVPTTRVTIPAGQRLPEAATNLVGVVQGTTEVVVSAPGVAPDRRAVVVDLRGELAPTNVTQPAGFTTAVTVGISGPAPSGGVEIALSSDDDVASFPSSVMVPPGELSTTFDVVGTNLGNGVIEARGTALGALGAALARFDLPGLTVTTTDAPTATFDIRPGRTYQVGTGLQVRAGVQLSADPPRPTDVTITSSAPGVTLSTDPGTIGTDTLVLPDVTSSTFLGFYVQGAGAPGAVGAIEVNAPLFVGDTRDAALLESTLALTARSISVDEPPASALAEARAIPDPGSCTESFCNTGSLLRQQLLPGTIDLTLTSSDPAVLALVAPDGSRVGSTTTSLAASPFGLDEVAWFTIDGLAPGFSELGLATPPGFTTTAAQRQLVQVVQPELRLNFGSSRPVALGQGLQTTMGVNLTATPASPVDITLTVPADSGITLAATADAVGSTTLVLDDVATVADQRFWVQDRSGGAVGTRVTVTATAPGFTGDAEQVERRPKGVVFQGWLGQAGGVLDVGQSIGGSVELAALATGFQYPSYRLNRPLSPQEDPYLVNAQAVGPDGPLDVTITSSGPSIASLDVAGANRPLPTTLSLQPGEASIPASVIAEQLGTTLLAIEQPVGFTVPGEFFSNEDFDAFALEVRGKQLFQFSPWDEVVGRDLRSFLPQTSSLVDRDVTVTVADPTVASLSRADGSTEVSSITYAAGTSPLLQVNGLVNGSTVVQFRADGYTPVDVAVTVTDPAVFFTAGDLTVDVDQVLSLYADDVDVQVATGIQLPGSSNTRVQGLRPGRAAVPVGIVSDDVAVVTTDPDAATIGPADDGRGSALLVPGGSTGFAELSLVPPTDWVLPTTGKERLQVRVDAPTASFVGTQSVLAVDGQDAFDVVAEYGPPEATTRTVRSSAPSVAVVSADPTTAGAGSITVPLAAGQTSATYHVQALSPGTTQITVESGAYPDISFDVEVLPSTVRWSRSSYDTSAPQLVILGLYGVRADGSTVSVGDTLRPGVSVTAGLSSSDPMVVGVPATVTFDPGNRGRVVATDVLGFGTSGSAEVSITQPVRTGYVAPPANGTLVVLVR